MDNYGTPGRLPCLYTHPLCCMMAIASRLCFRTPMMLHLHLSDGKQGLSLASTSRVLLYYNVMNRAP